jgi:UDP-glucose 4-epimerase
MRKKALVTGGYGFLGRETALKFQSQGFHVSGIGHGRWDKSEYSLCGFDKWLDANVTISGLLTLNEKFDVIAHCAGNGSVGYSIANPLQDFKKTVGTTSEVLEYMRLRNSRALLIYPSSAGVYGAKEDVSIKETDSLNPISPYGYHKKIVEELCESYSKSYNLKIAVIRFFSIYGSGLTKQLLWDASSNLLTARGDAVFWGTGEETRDWINIQDATELILKVSGCKDRFTILNGANGARVTVRAVLEMLREELGTSGSIKFNNNVRDGDPRFYHAAISKAKSLGWSPKILLRDGISQYVKWYNGLHNQEPI